LARNLSAGNLYRAGFEVNLGSEAGSRCPSAGDSAILAREKGLLFIKVPPEWCMGILKFVKDRAALFTGPA